MQRQGSKWQHTTQLTDAADLLGQIGLPFSGGRSRTQQSVLVRIGISVMLSMSLRVLEEQGICTSGL